ncbi:hypothetical protein B0O80DRAFT_15751 [Mortierella sp. GBAus27b]|nr:hypothetical protein B0O80DRAFT_15751 [Mortierella sp. GBAus27b]
MFLTPHSHPSHSLISILHPAHARPASLLLHHPLRPLSPDPLPTLTIHTLALLCLALQHLQPCTALPPSLPPHTPSCLPSPTSPPCCRGRSRNGSIHRSVPSRRQTSTSIPSHPRPPYSSSPPPALQNGNLAHVHTFGLLQLRTGQLNRIEAKAASLLAVHTRLHVFMYVQSHVCVCGKSCKARDRGSACPPLYAHPHTLPKRH